jgi:hypothetical protein
MLLYTGYYCESCIAKLPVLCCLNNPVLLKEIVCMRLTAGGVASSEDYGFIALEGLSYGDDIFLLL